MPPNWTHTNPLKCDNASAGCASGEADMLFRVGHKEPGPWGQHLRSFPKQTATSRLWMTETWADEQPCSCVWQATSLQLHSPCVRVWDCICVCVYGWVCDCVWPHMDACFTKIEILSEAFEICIFHLGKVTAAINQHILMEVGPNIVSYLHELWTRFHGLL